MITDRERFRRVTGLDSTPPAWDYAGERRLFYIELVAVWGYRIHQRSRTCRACLHYEASDCETCERYEAHLVHGTHLPKEMH